MKIYIWLLAGLIAVPAFASEKTAFVVNTGNRAYQERVLLRATTRAVTDSAVITVCGAGASMLYNSDIEANVLLQRAEAAGVQIRKCGAAHVTDLALQHSE